MDAVRRAILGANILILEGTDGVGKTTAARLLRDLGTRYRHFGPPDPTRDWWQQFALPAVWDATARKPVVYDRSFLHENVWASLFRREPLLKPHQRVRLCQLHAALGTVVVTLVRPEDEIMEELGRRGEDPVEIGRSIAFQRLICELHEDDRTGLPQLVMSLPAFEMAVAT